MQTQLAIQKFLLNRQSRNLSPKTLQWYSDHLKTFARSYPELPTNPELIEDFLANMLVSPATKHAYFRTLKAFYRFISSRYNLPNPVAQLRPPYCPKKVMPTLEPREIMSLLNSPKNLRDRALLTLFVDTGARASELAKLRKQDLKTTSILVNGKTGEREIPITDESYHLLLSLISLDGKSDYIFTGRNGKPLTRYGIYTLIRKLMKKVGITGPKLGPHRIRHAFGKSYLVNGGDVRSLQQLMGHANITTTQKYTSLSLTDLQDKHNRFTPLRTAHTAAQESLFDNPHIIREAQVEYQAPTIMQACEV